MKPSTYIANQWHLPKSGDTRDIIDPATLDTIETIGYAGAPEALDAVAAAHQAFDVWKKTTVYARAAKLRELADAIRQHSQAIARILTLEVGKPLPESLGEVNAAADQFEWYAEEVKRAAGDVIPSRLENRRHLTIRHPVGPVAAIAPWNFPLLLSARKMAPALAAGCPVVLRPASQAPLALIEVFKLIQAADFPPGVVNLVVGAPDACSGVFVDDPRIQKISFTGSLDVGLKLYTACAARMKKISLELGGHSPFLILPDMAVEQAADCAVFAKFRNMGQVCISASRFYVPKAMGPDFEAAVTERVQKLKIGNGLDPQTDVGPLFEKKRVDESLKFVADIKAKGGRILCGGKPPEGEPFGRGHFFMPTAAAGITPEMAIMQEEPFVPILPIISYESVDQVFAMANDTPYGLAAYVFTNDLRLAIRAAEKLEAGIIGINDCSPAAAQCPFGGLKQSGLGREGWHQGLEAYYETKYISIGL